MLIVNDEQRLGAGIASLSKRCSYCTKALAAYPLIVSDNARLQVTMLLAPRAGNRILVDLYTFLPTTSALPALVRAQPALCCSQVRGGARVQSAGVGEINRDSRHFARLTI